MEEHAAAPDGLWLTSWVIANAPWIFAGIAAGIVRLVYRLGLDNSPFRQAVSEALLCAVVVSVLAPVAAKLGFSQDWAMVIGVGIGFAGPEVVRNFMIDRVKSFFRGK